MSSGTWTLTVICVENKKEWAKYAPLGCAGIEDNGW